MFPRKHVRSCLDTIFKYNVMSFEEGTMGAINGMRPDGKPDLTSPQVCTLLSKKILIEMLTA